MIKKTTSCPICNGLSEEIVNKLLTIASLVKFSHDQSIYLQGDKFEGLYVVSSGKVRLSNGNDNGKEVFVKIIHGGESFGESGITKSEYLENAFVSEDAMCIFLPNEKIQEIMAEHVEFSMAMFKAVNKWLVEFYNRFKILSHLSVKKRLELYLQRELDQAGSNEVEFELRRHEIASNLGVRPETLSRALKDLVDLGAITLSGKKIKVTNLEKTF